MVELPRCEEGSSMSELEKLKKNANSMAECLKTMLRRIDKLELESDIIKGNSMATSSPHQQNNCYDLGTTNYGEDKGNEAHLSKETTVREYISIDADGHQKIVTVIERSLQGNGQNTPRNRNLHSPSSPAPENGVFEDFGSQNRLLASAYEARIVTVKAELLTQIGTEFICGQLVAVKVIPEISDQIHPGDTILELNGTPILDKAQFNELNGDVKLKLVLSDIYTAPMEFCKILEDYKSNCSETESKKKLLPYLSFDVKKGDILQILSKDNTNIQARKVNDLSKTGFVPSSLKIQSVGMLCPYGRRVGRRTLKRMLLEHLPHRFSTVIPMTSRTRKPNEQHGREYNFQIKGDMEGMIRNGKFIEHGEYKEQIYGTSIESVREIVRSGRMCILDCTENALNCLYNTEFMPFVVAIAAPPLEELINLNTRDSGESFSSSSKKKSHEELKETSEKSERLLKSEHSKYFDLVIVNKNREITFKKLLDALEKLKNEAQWVPVNWLKR